jgi:hypothetical protein
MAKGDRRYDLMIRENGKLGKKPEDKKPGAPIAFGMP